ncbi:hypothetical protein [Microbulbifer sp. TYP-18]|uniref:hypothetical protein n=1 Tax=Microbulbifer sp. TYP-18 TaxID=3230024 RepID=UPI0034C6CF34
MTIWKAAQRPGRKQSRWPALASAVVVGAIISGCNTQQTQQQPPAQPSQSSSSSSSSSQSSSPSSPSPSPSGSQPQTAGTSPGSTPRPPGAAGNPMPTIESGRNPGRQTSGGSDGGEDSARRRESARDGSPDPRGREPGGATPTYSDADTPPEQRNMPPDPSTSAEGQPPDEIDFSEEESSSSSSSSAASDAAPSGNPSSASGGSSSSRSAAQASAGGPAASGSAPNEAPASSAERVAELEGEFDATMVSYDGMILRERDYVRNRPSADTQDDEESMDEPPLGESLEDLIESAEAEIPQPPGGGPEGGGAEQNNSSGQVTGPGAPTAGRIGEFDHKGTTPVVPADIPDGNDDDVVARQIREAATRETDPELREKLWEEYRKYKNAKR